MFEVVNFFAIHKVLVCDVLKLCYILNMFVGWGGKDNKEHRYC